jgi:hypothetical protein
MSKKFSPKAGQTVNQACKDAKSKGLDVVVGPSNTMVTYIQLGDHYLNIPKEYQAAVADLDTKYLNSCMLRESDTNQTSWFMSKPKAVANDAFGI